MKERTEKDDQEFTKTISSLKKSEDEAKEETKRATRHYARRQETWFSRDGRITWLSADSSTSARKEVALATIIQR